MENVGHENSRIIDILFSVVFSFFGITYILVYYPFCGVIFKEMSAFDCDFGPTGDCPKVLVEARWYFKNYQ